MPYIQKSSPPPNQVLKFTMMDFSGGLNNRSTILRPNQASNIQNMMFTDATIMDKRNGSKLYDALNLGAPVTFIDEYKPYAEADQLIRSTSTKLYVGNTLARTLVNRADGVNFQGKYFFADASGLYVYGKFPQTTTTYERVVGTPTSAYRVFKVVSCPTSYTPLPTEHTRGVSVFDYTAGTIYYEPCTNEKNDAYKGSSVVPDAPRYLVSHKGRLYVSGSDKNNDTVYLTDASNPYYFAVGLPLQVPPNSDKVKGLVVFDDAVVVGRGEDVHVISGTTNNPNLGMEMFKVRKLNTHTGLASDQSATVAHNFLFFLGNDGNAYALSTVNTDTKTLATTIISQDIDLFSTPISVSRTDLASATAFFKDDMWYVSIGNKTLVYSYRHRAWTLWTGLGITSMHNLNGTIIWGNTLGETCTFSTDFLDKGKPYRALWSSMNYDNGDPSTYKQYREFYVLAHTFEGYRSDIRITFEADYAEINSEFVIENQISSWGMTRWGERFINKNINSSLPFIIGRRARQIKLTFVNGYDVFKTVATYADLDAVLGKKEGILVYVTADNKYYLYKDFAWIEKTTESLNQPMRIYQVNGDFELRGKR